MNKMMNPVVGRLRGVLFVGGLTLAAALSACSGQQVDRTGWECWEEVACAQGFLCNELHQCEPAITDIPGVDPIALAAFNDGVRAMNETPRNYVEALAFFERAIQHDPDFWEALENIGLIQLDLGRYGDAADTFEAEVALIDDLVAREWPVDPRLEVYLNIGKARALANDTNGAAEAFGRMLQLDPENAEARANLAALNLQSGNLDGARAFISELLELSQNDVGALSVLAQIAKEQGDMQLAEYLWEKCMQEIDGAMALMEIDCDSVDLTVDLGENPDAATEVEFCAQFAELSVEEAERRRAYNTRRADRMRKMLSDIQNELGIVARAAGDDDGAESFFRQAVGNNTSNVAARVNLGTIYLQYAFWGSACEQFGEALALRPRDQGGLVGRAACTYGAGDVDTAYQHYQDVADDFSSNTYATEQLGYIAFQDMNDFDAAIRWFSRNLDQRGLNADTCNPDTDEVCQVLKSIIDVRRQQREMGVQPTE